MSSGPCILCTNQTPESWFCLTPGCKNLFYMCPSCTAASGWRFDNDHGASRCDKCSGSWWTELSMRFSGNPKIW